MRVDGYHYDSDDDFSKNIITLIISDFQNEDSYQTFNTTQLEQKFRLVERFIRSCSDPSFVNLVEEVLKVLKLFMNFQADLVILIELTFF